MIPSTFPALTALGLTGTLAAGLAHSAYASLRQLGGHPGFEQRSKRCGSGNIVSYHVRPGLPGGGAVVCEAGLMNTSTAWLMLASHLPPATTVVLPDRAGYRRSLRCCPERYCFQESVGDLAEVITDAVPDGEQLVLAGHSLGGYLAHRTTAALPGRAAGLVLVDPSHPRELRHSTSQRAGSRGMDLTLRLGAGSAAFGSGLLMDKRGLFGYAEGNPHLPALRREVSAVSTWRAARREWAYTFAFMVDGGRPLDQVDVPVRVLAAASTAADTPEHLDLYRDYVVSGTDGQVETVPGSDHLSILGGVGPVTTVAARIAEMLIPAAASSRPLSLVGGPS